MQRLWIFVIVALLAFPAFAQEDPDRSRPAGQQEQSPGEKIEHGAKETGEAVGTAAEQTAKDVKQQTKDSKDSAEIRAEATDRLQRAATVMHEIMQTPDKAIPQEVLDGARCVAVAPDVFKAGFVFGGRHGRGVATCRTSTGWSAPYFFTLSGGSWGAQIGAQSTDLILMVMTDKGMKDMLQNKLELGADATVAAGPVGRHAQAGTDWKLETAILSYSRSKGLFAGLELQGSVIRPDEDSTRAIYGRYVPPALTLMGKVEVPAVAQGFLRAVANAKAVSEAKR